MMMMLIILLKPIFLSILNEHNEQIIKNKFEGYYKLVYNNQLEYHYDNLWKNNIIFSNTYNTSNWTN